MLKKIQKFIHENKEELKENGMMIHDDHALPSSRRDLLAMGFYTAGYTAVLPSVGSILLDAKEARAAECPSKPPATGVPFLQIHASGGWLTRDIIHGLAGNGIDGSDPGRPAPWTRVGGGFSVNDYYQWGIAAPHHPSVEEPFKLGGHLMPRHSAAYLAAQDFYQTEDLTTTRLNGKFHLFSFNHRSPDDSRTTLQSFLASTSALRAHASDFPVSSTSAGTNLTGVNALSAFSVNKTTNVVPGGGDISSMVNTGDLPAEKRPDFVSMISESVKARLTDADAKFLMGCSTQEAVALVKAYSQALDPAEPYPALAANIPNNDRLRSLMGMLFSNIASVGGISLGGYDYHGSTAQVQQDRNFAVWRNNIFPVVDAAIQANKPMLLAITSDGSVRCSVSEMAVTTTITINGNAVDRNFVMPQGVGDFGRNGTTLLIAVGDVPAGAIKFHQSGYALAGGGVARDGNLIGYDQVASSSAILETIRRLSNHLNPTAKLTKTFQDATDGARLNAALEAFIPVNENV